MCVCAYKVSSRTQVKQVKFTLVQTNVIKYMQVARWWLYGVHFLINQAHIISIRCTCLSASYICFKIFIKASSVGLNLFSLHLYTKNFACKRIKKKPSSVVVFLWCPKRISVVLIENLAQLKLFSFKHISNLTQKDWVCSHWHIKWKMVSFFLSSKTCIHCSGPLPYPSELSLSQEFYGDRGPRVHRRTLHAAQQRKMAPMSVDMS